MKLAFRFALVLLATLNIGFTELTRAAPMQDRVREAVGIVREKQNSSSPIPRRILDNAKGVAVIEITKGGFGVSGQHGEGILIAKTKDGWSAPSAFNASGGGIGLQVGVEVRRLIYILNNADALNAFAQNDKFRLNAIANATAGPDSVTEEASTINQHNIFVYSITDGAFAGAAIGGDVMGTDLVDNRDAYGGEVSTGDILNGKVPTPAYAQALYDALGF